MKIIMKTQIYRLVCLHVIFLCACTNLSDSPSQPPLAETQVPEPTLTQVQPAPSTTAVSTLASLPDGGLVYGDPGGRFSLPLVGDWLPVETDGSYGHFRLAEPELEMYVVTVDSEDLEDVAETGLRQIGIDPSTLSELGVVPLEHWTVSAYALDSDHGVSLAARQLGDAAVAVILSGELSLTTAPPAEAFLTLDGLALMPLADYLEFQPPTAPSTVEDIENLYNIEFYSGNTKLTGKLVLPDGEGPFSAVVCVPGSAPATRTECDHVVPAFLGAGLAVFSYDKRGVGDSEGIFVGVTDINDNPSPSEWRMPQLAGDALAAVTFLHNLKEINSDQIGLLGGSQAGSIIPQVAANSKIPTFAVVAIGQTVPVGEAHYYQQFTGKVRRLPSMTESERDELSEQLADFDGIPGFDPRPYIEAMEIPALWIWGDLDGWIPPRKSRLEMENLISEQNKDFTIIYDPDYGHEWPSSWTSQVVDWVLTQLEE
jgi:pimeloyl-ACP methyl ester carboxylesterase